MNSKVEPGAAIAPLVLIVALFFLWGVANNLNDVLMPHLRKAFFLNDFQSSLVQSAFYLGYFFLALPAGWERKKNQRSLSRQNHHLILIMMVSLIVLINVQPFQVLLNMKVSRSPILTRTVSTTKKINVPR